MTFADVWNYIVARYEKNYSAQEVVVQQEWEQYFSELFNYRRLFGEIDAHRTIHIGSGHRTIPDIIINTDGRDLFDVELKQYNLPFNIEMENQLKSYMDLLHISVGILVCQKIYVYVYDYSQSQLKKIDIDFTKDNPYGIEFVSLLQKGSFSVEKIEDFIDSRKKLAENVEKIQSQISEDLIRSLLEEHFKKTYSENEITSAMKGMSFYHRIKTDETLVFDPSTSTGEDVKEVFAQTVKNHLLNYEQQQKLRFYPHSGKYYIRFQTSEMSALLPEMSKKGSWGYGAKYLFWLGEQTEHSFKACFELGGWDMDEQTFEIMNSIIRKEKPGDTKLEFRYKRIYTKVYSYTAGTVDCAIKTAVDDLLSWQSRLLKKM